MFIKNILLTFNFFTDIDLIRNLLLLIDAIIYDVFAKIFTFYVDLASHRIFDETGINSLLNRVYIVIGIIALFIVSYSLLKAIVNPEKNLKEVGSKLIVNFVTSIIIISLIPTIFNVAYDFQEIIIGDQLIGKVILGNAPTLKENNLEYNDVMKTYGNVISFMTLNSFLNPNNVNVSVSYEAPSVLDVGRIGTLGIILPGDILNAFYNMDLMSEILQQDDGKLTWSEATALMLANGEFTIITAFSQQIESTDSTSSGAYIEYYPIISTICGGLLLYCMISFCLEVGLRAVKLTFLQMLAPIPILLRMVPGQDKIFGNWLKLTITTFAEVFIRIIVLYTVAYLVSLLPSLSIFSNSTGFIGKAIIIMGLIMFAKQGPELISKVTGVDSSNMKLGIMDKLAAGGILAGAAAVGGGLTAGLKNAVSAYKGTEGKKGAKIANAFKSGLAGAGSAAVRSGAAGKGAKSFADVKKAASAGAMKATDKREQHANYKKEHSKSYRAAYNASDKKTKFGRAIDAMQAGVIGGHIYDAGESILSWLGATGNVDEAKRETKVASDIQASTKKIKNLSSDYVEKHMKDIFVGLDAVEEGTLKTYHDAIRKLTSQGYSEESSEMIAAKADLTKFSMEHASKRLDVIKAASEVSVDAQIEELTKKRRELEVQIENSSGEEKIKLEGQLSAVGEQITKVHLEKADATNKFKAAVKTATDNFASTAQWLVGAEAEKKEINLTLEDLQYQLDKNAASRTVQGIYSGSEELSIKGLDKIGDALGHEGEWVKSITKMAEESERINRNIISQEERRQAKKQDK